jgi:hypothetical protein
VSFIISADELKKTIPGYSPNRSEAFHRESARLADRLYAKALKERSEKTVILMAGGTASGKSEYVSVYLTDLNAIILDGTLPTFSGAEIKIKSAKKANKNIEIRLVLPEVFVVAFVAFLNRDRKFSNEHFFRTHSNSRKTVLEIAEKFPEIPVKVIYSDASLVSGKSTMSFREIIFDNRPNLIELLKGEQYTEDSIKKEVFDL